MTTYQIGVLLLLHQQGSNCILGLSHAGGSHSHHRIIPSPGCLPLPVLPNPLFCLLHLGKVNLTTVVWEQTYRSHHCRVIAVHLFILISIRLGLCCEIQTVLGCQWRYLLNDIIPMCIALLAQSLTPGLCNLKGTMPLTQLERRIDGCCCWQSFLSCYTTTKDIAVVLLVIISKVAHKLGGFIDQACIFLQECRCWVGTIEQLCQINKVRLLPDKETSHS